MTAIVSATQVSNITEPKEKQCAASDNQLISVVNPILTTIGVLHLYMAFIHGIPLLAQTAFESTVACISSNAIKNASCWNSESASTAVALAGIVFASAVIGTNCLKKACK